MIRFRLHLGLPVLTKELIEQANRKRTYFVRFLYALLLFGLCGVIFYILLLETRARPVELLGSGRWMFEFLFWVQIGGIYLLLPALLSGAITVEKERNTLQLLLLTELRPWEILLQKLLSRIVVIFTVVLLNLPLLAVTYAFGGVSGEQLALGIYALGLTTLQVGAFAIMCSAFFRTTAVAFITSYIGLGLLYAMLPIIYEVLWEFGRYIRVPDERYIALLPMFSYLTRVTWPATGGAAGGAFSITAVLRESWPVFVSIAIFLLAGRWYLTARAMLRPGNPVRAVFRWLDRFFGTVNRKVAGGIELIRSVTGADLPDEKPVAWLERTRRSIARPHYLIRLFLVTTLPTVMLCAAVFIWSPQSIHDAVPAMVFILWPVLVLWLAIQGAGTFAAERAGQTLGVLMTTPLTTRQILREKVSALWRFAAVVALPLVTVQLFGVWIKHRFPGGVYNYHSTPDFGSATYAMFSLMSVVVYLWLVVWLSVWLGMWMRTQTRAAIAAVVAILAWCITPFLVAVPVILIAQMGGRLEERSVLGLLMATPVMVVPSLEFQQFPNLGDESPWPAAWIFGTHFAAYAAVALVLRTWCYAGADRLLGRVAPP